MSFKIIAFISLYTAFGISLCSGKTTLEHREIPETDRLVAIAKIWGYLKYYHPQVASGKYNWDQELFNVLGKLPEVKTTEEFSRFSLEWINRLGEIQPCKACSKPSTEKVFNQNFDLTWTQDSSMFSAELCMKLKYIENNRFRGKNYYVVPDLARNFKMINEPKYKASDWIDEKFRLLLLFKYWNTVEYFYPYKYMTDQNWDDVLVEMIPKFRNVKSEMDFHLTLCELAIKLDDSHAFFHSELVGKFFGTKRVPIEYQILDEKIVITGLFNDSLARVDDLRIGDAIIALDGKPIMEIFEKNKKYINGSNNVTKLSYSFVALLRGNTPKVEIKYERDGKIFTKTINRYERNEINYKESKPVKWKLMKDNIGYVDMGEVEKKDVKPMMKSLMDTKAIIFDIRNYPNFILYDIASYLNSEPREAVYFTRPDYTYPGKFVWTKPIICGRKNKHAYKGKVIILMNEDTQSRAEFTCMCLATANNVTTVGSQTSAADGNVSDFIFFDDKSTWITGLGVFYPDGRATQRVGLKPDIEIRPTIEGIRLGKDELLERAIELINK